MATILIISDLKVILLTGIVDFVTNYRYSMVIWNLIHI